MKKVTITARELVLIGILVVIVAYYFVVQGPVSRQMEELESRKADLETQYELLQVEARQLSTMRKAVDEAFEAAGGTPQAIAEYNNVNTVMKELNSIFAGVDDYTINFGSEVKGADVVKRPIEIRFSTSSYDDARAKLDAIEQSSLRYFICDLSVSNGSSRTRSSVWSVAVTLEVFEALPDEVADASDAADDAAA